MAPRFKELEQLLNDLRGKNRANQGQLSLLFELNNHFFPHIKETGKHCSTCRQRVYKRMKDFYWEEINKK